MIRRIVLPVKLWRDGVLLDPDEYVNATPEALAKAVAARQAAQLIASAQNATRPRSAKETS